MTTYRLWPSTNGPASTIAFSGNFIAGTLFSIHGGVAWFQGYWWWVAASGQSTAPVKCALWSAGTSGTGMVVPGSVVTSDTLTAGQWNFIPLTSPIPLAPGHDPANSVNGSPYIAAIGVNGAFLDTGNYWSAGNPGAAGLWGNGVTNSPLFAYSANTGGTTAPPPYAYGQGMFSTGGSDPSVTMPTQISGGDNFWVDVQISDTAPVGYTGPYRLWPNKFDDNPGSAQDDNVAYSIATEIDTSTTLALNAVHYYVPANASAAAGLVTKVSVWDTASQTKVASISAPAWTTESGGATPALGTNAGFWARAAFANGVTLPPGKYRVAIYNANGALGNWGPKDASTAYYVTGAGAAGITNGPLTAPNMANAQVGDFFPGTGTGTTTAQPVFAFDGLDSYPHYTTGNNPGQNYWIDLEASLLPVVNVNGLTASVTVAAPAGTASASSPPPPAFPVDAQATMSFSAYTSVTASATIELEAGQPVTMDGAALPSDPWTSMYPG